MEKILFVLAALVICVNGIRFIDESRIVSGTNVTGYMQFPYVISLQQMSLLPNQVTAHRCGGAMITLQHALTAAQCLYYYDANMTLTYITAGQYRVFAGDILLTGDNVTDRVRYIANYTIHPEHVAYPALLHDIAVVTLATPFLNTTVVPLSLPTADFIPEDFTRCSMAGWGAMENTATVVASNVLQYTIKYTYKHSLCTSVYSALAGTLNVHPSMLCAASYDIISVGCTGDEGNALVCDGQLTGILSFTNRCLMTSYPEVYTRVSNYTTWIRSISAGSSFKPALGLFILVALVCAKIFS